MRAFHLYFLAGCLVASGCVTSKLVWKQPAKSDTATAAKEEASKPADDAKKEAAKPATAVAAAPAKENPPATASEKPAATPAAETATPPQTAAVTSANNTPAAGTPQSTAPAPEATVADSPFKSSRPPQTPTATESSGVVTAAKVATEELPVSSGRSVKNLNKETLQLIDRELADATPEERAEWFDQLKHVDPSIVPDILRARRMSMQLVQKSTPDLESAETSFAGGPMTEIAGSGFRSPLPQVPPSSSHPPADLPHWSTANPSGVTPSSAGIQPVTHRQEEGNRGLVRADYSRPAGERAAVEHAVHEEKGATASPRVLLQNHETVAAGPPGTPYPQWSTVAGNAAPPAGASTSASGIPWPPQKAETPPPAGGLTAVASHIPFGSNIVQNVVGLVPGRGQQTANQPTSLVTPASATQAGSPTQPVSEGFRAQLDQTTAFLEQEVASLTPGNTPESQAHYVRQHVALRLLYLMSDHQERALTAIPAIAPAEQEFWQQLIWGMINSLDVQHMPQAKDRATQTITQLSSALRRLQEQADLQIRHVAFCRQILYFGNYEKLPRNEFSPGQEALLYAEIDHFKSQPTAEGQYRTLLRSTIEILSPSGELRKQIEFPATEDLCSTYRRDYFHNYQFRIPERMPLGPHVVKLTVIDELSGKMNSYSLNFVVK